MSLSLSVPLRVREFRNFGLSFSEMLVCARELASFAAERCLSTQLGGEHFSWLAAGKEKIFPQIVLTA